MWTDDPVADFHRYDAAQERKLQRYPKCAHCDEHITDRYYDIEGVIICKDCLDSDFGHDVDDYID